MINYILIPFRIKKLNNENFSYETTKKKKKKKKKKKSKINRPKFKNNNIII